MKKSKILLIVFGLLLALVITSNCFSAAAKTYEDKLGRTWLAYLNPDSYDNLQVLCSYFSNGNWSQAFTLTSDPGDKTILSIGEVETDIVYIIYLDGEGNTHTIYISDEGIME